MVRNISKHLPIALIIGFAIALVALSMVLFTRSFVTASSDLGPPLTSDSVLAKPDRPTPTPSYVDWSDVTNKPAGFADNLDDDVLAGLACDIWQLARWNGSAWECFSLDLAALEERVAALEALHVPTPISGLVSWWPGEGNANDVVGANHGTLQGGTTFTTGMIGQAFSFDGTDDFVLVPDSPDLTLPGDVTFTFWAKRTVFDGTWSNMFGKGDNPVSYRLAFAPSNHLAADFEHDDGSDEDIGGPLVDDFDWHHYAYVRDGNTHHLFLDGVEEASGSFIGTAAAAVGEPVVIGVLRSEPDPSDRQFFGGIVDEVKLFNRALTDEEVQAIFNES